MSVEDAKNFLVKALEDEEIQGQLKGCTSEEKFFSVVQEAGFSFTKEEWIAVSPKKGEKEGFGLGREAHRSPGTARWEIKGK